MAQELPTKITGLKYRPFKTDEIFFLLSDSFRRKVIRGLANGVMKTAVDLNAGSGKKRHAYLKHIRLLCDAGIVIQKENPQDARKPLHGLAPGVRVCKLDDFWAVDFGCYMLRVS